MAHQPSRDIEPTKRGGRTVREIAKPRREAHSTGRVDKFLAAALDLFAERNFASVTIKDIARALRVNTALIWLANHVNKYAEIHRFVKIALDFRGAHEGDPDIASAIEGFYVEERKLLSKIIREGIKQGLFKPVDPNRMAQFISTHLDGCMVRSVILSDFDLDGAVRDLHKRVLEMLGYSPKKRSKRAGRRASA